jgi:phage terminase large subunit
MLQRVNEVYRPLFTEHPRYFILMGGRGAGRSTVASQFANAKLIAPEYFRCAIMRYVWSDIRESIYKEITDRVDENELGDKIKINDSTMLIEYGANSIKAVGFRKSSEGRKAKLKSLASYNYVIIEEADEIPEEDFMQLDDSLRTVKGNITIILLLNPPAKEHWILRRWFDLDKSEQKDFYLPKLKSGLTDTLAICNDYHCNEENIAPASILQYEAYKESKPFHYWNMIKGLVPETVRGKIYKGWKMIDSVPTEARLIRRGLDFGYSIDPTVIEDIYTYNGGFIVDEICYQKGLSNKSIADIILGQDKQVLVVADSSEPKSIDEIISYGVSIVGSQKGAGSVNQGIAYVQDQPISLTSRSKKTKKAYENYAWLVNKDGDIINTPDDRVHEWSNSMDATRYGMESLKPQADDDELPPDDTLLISRGLYR